MVRIALVAAVAAAAVAASVDASATCAQCSNSACDATYLKTVNPPTSSSVAPSALYTCATTSVNGTVPSNLVYDNTGHPAANAVVTLLGLLAAGGETAKVGLLKQPFGFLAVAQLAELFLTGAGAKGCNGIPTMPIVDPTEAQPTTLQVSSAELCPGIDAATQAQLDQELLAVIETIQDYYIYAFAAGMYDLLAPCFNVACKPLVGYLCNNPTADGSIPADVPSSLKGGDVTLVSAAAGLTSLAQQSINNINLVLTKNKNSPTTQTAIQAGFLKAVPVSGSTKINPSVTITANLTGLPCDTALSFFQKPSSASAQGASAVAAAAAFSAAVFAL